MNEFLTMADLVARLREIRQSQRLSQKSLGERCGQSQQYINSIEQGKRVPTFETAATIAEVLGFRLVLQLR